MMPKQNTRVIPIRRDILASDEDREVADLAHNLWLATGFRGGTPEEALLTAVRTVRGKASAGLFVVSKRKSNLHPFTVMRLPLN